MRQFFFFFFSSRRRHTRCSRDWSSDVCSSDLVPWHPAWLAAVGVVLLALPLVLPTFWVWMAVEIFAFALFAASLHLLMGLGGMVSFGHAAYFGLGAYGAALLLKLAGWPMPLAFLAG